VSEVFRYTGAAYRRCTSTSCGDRSLQNCSFPIQRNYSLQYLVFLFCLLSLASAAAQVIRPEPAVPPEAPVPTKTYDGLKWRLIGPFRGGRVVAVTGVPGDPNTFYFGAVDGGIWQTSDAGVVWRPIFDGQHIASIGALAVAPSNPKTIYAGTGESDIRSDLSSGDGVYKSADGGQTWTNVGLRDSRQISRIVVDPQNAEVAYVAVLGHAYGPNPERGVYKTSDGGAHWNRVLDQGPEVGAADLAIASENPNILFATMWRARRPPWSVYGPLGGPGSSLFRSLDGGQSWSHLSGTGLPDGDWGRAGVAVSSNGSRVYALIDAKKAGLYRSDDGGSTWSLVNSDSRLTSRSWYFNDITIDPQNPDVIYVPNVALYRSEDGGKTISIVRGAPGGDDYHEIWVDPKDSTRMILGTDQGTTISVDYGKTWSSWYNQPTAQLYHVITDNKFPYAVYGAQQDSGGMAIFSRTDHGQITARDWFSPGGSESGYIAPDPNDPNVVYLSGTYGSVERFDLRTSLSQNITPWPVANFGTEINERKYRDPWTPVLLFSPFDKKALYLGTQFVMKTTDGGLHWQTISPDLTGASPQPPDEKTDEKKPEGPTTVENAKQRGYGVVYTIAPSSLNGSLIWAGSDTGLIHLTRDGGKTWKDVTPKAITDWSKISFIEASHFDPAEAYAAVDRHRLDDQQPYLYRTRDYGASWQLITEGIPAPSFLRAVRQDPQDRQLLFAGTELGIYVSFDDGDHWQSLQLNLPATSVQDMVVHGDDLVIATHGRSFWILDDISSLRQASQAAEADAAWLYSPATTVRVDNDGFLGTPLPPEEPSAENPPNGAIIDYYLKNAAEHIQLDILDAQGGVVHSFSTPEAQSKTQAETPAATKEAKRPPVPIAERWFPKPQVLDLKPGMHRFIWDLTWTGASGKPEEHEPASEYGSPRGPRVTPGTYTVRLNVDGKSLTQPLRVTMDPRSAATAQDLEEQYQLGRKMFGEATAVRQSLSEIHSVQARLAAAEGKLSAQQSELKSSVTEAQDAIKKILAGTGARTGDATGLDLASASIAAALRVVESSDRTVPSQAIALFEESDRAAKLRMDEWSRMKSTVLPLLQSIETGK
jgi:photosystem II stability/assembly factor-like uncharacterized protein